MRQRARPRILLADDHRPWLEEVCLLLSPYFDVVGAACDGATLVSEALRLVPDVIVTDISMPALSGIDAVHRLRQAGSKVKVVFLTIHTEEELINACMAEGALGYIQKSNTTDHLIPAIEAAVHGRAYVSTNTS
jgi:DNA-binding NarL/FixJ family response regulator